MGIDKPDYIGHLDHAETQKRTDHTLVTVSTDHGESGLLRSGRDAITRADAASQARSRARGRRQHPRLAALTTGEVEEAAARSWTPNAFVRQTDSQHHQRPAPQPISALTTRNCRIPAVRELTQRLEAL